MFLQEERLVFNHALVGGFGRSRTSNDVRVSFSARVRWIKVLQCRKERFSSWFLCGANARSGSKRRRRSRFDRYYGDFWIFLRLYCNGYLVYR